MINPAKAIAILNAAAPDYLEYLKVSWIHCKILSEQLIIKPDPFDSDEYLKIVYDLAEKLASRYILSLVEFLQLSEFYGNEPEEKETETKK